MRANSMQVAKNIARILSRNPKKVRQLETLQSITIHLTSDDHVTIKCELFRNHLARYTITGTRSTMTLTADITTNEIARKPRGEQPWYEAETDMYAEDILKLI